MKKIILTAIALPLLFACAKEEKTNSTTDIIEYNTETVKGETTVENSAETITQIAIKANEDMTYSIQEFAVKQGEEITLTLVNTGTSSKEAMGHNLVILKKEADLNSFLFEASSAKENEYIPNNTDAIIAHTKLLGPKENDQIKFKIDEKGTYTFVCTFPGHAGTMKGTIKVV